mgnify:CR=1 FL=1
MPRLRFGLRPALLLLSLACSGPQAQNGSPAVDATVQANQAAKAAQAPEPQARKPRT